MKLYEEIKVDGFSHGTDYFERKNDADNLLRLVTSVREGGVISLSSCWGSGKTWFIKNFINYTEDQLKCLYYNTWKDENRNDPFSSFFSFIYNSLLDADPTFREEVRLSSLRDKYKSILKHLVPVLSRLVIGVAVPGDLDRVGEAVLQSTDGIALDILNSQKQKEKTEIEFRNLLSQLFLKAADNKPFVIFIDELDRCSPHYLIHFLEVLKHHFEIDNVVFILAIDYDRTLSTISHHYGSGIDPASYLRKIIHLQFRLSMRDTGVTNCLTNILHSLEPQSHSMIDAMSRFIINVFSRKYTITPRELKYISSVFILIKNTNRSFASTEFRIYTNIFLFLKLLKLKDRTVYEIIVNKTKIEQFDNFILSLSDYDKPSYGDDIHLPDFAKLIYPIVSSVFHPTRQYWLQSLVDSSGIKDLIMYDSSKPPRCDYEESRSIVSFINSLELE